jgi:hypothetical protein
MMALHLQSVMLTPYEIWKLIEAAAEELRDLRHNATYATCATDVSPVDKRKMAKEIANRIGELVGKLP